MGLSAIECPDGLCHSHHGGHAVERETMQSTLQLHGKDWCERLAERIYEISVDTFSQSVMPSLHTAGWQRRHLDWEFKLNDGESEPDRTLVDGMINATESFLRSSEVHRLFIQELVQGTFAEADNDDLRIQAVRTLVETEIVAMKTLGALLGFQIMQREGRLDRFLVFCHRTSIESQWLMACQRLGLRLEPWSAQPPGGDVDGLLFTYQGAGRHLNRVKAELDLWCGSRCLAIADEAHHLGVDPDALDQTAWGDSFLELTEPCRLRMGLTGTPFRADNLGFCAARRIKTVQNGAVVEQINPDLAVEPRELIASGDVRPLDFRFQDGWVEHSREGDPDRDVSPLSAEQRESWRARNLRRAVGLEDENSIGRQVLEEAQQGLARIRKSDMPRLLVS